MTSTCYGTQYALQYDTSKFILSPFLNCNASFPVIEKIAPKEEITFTAHFRYKTKETKIKLGFDLLKVDKNFDITKVKLNDIYTRQDKAKNLKWFEASIQ